MKITASYVLRNYQAAAAACLCTALTVTLAAASETKTISPYATEFEPGYRFVQAYFEDGPDLNSKGIDIGWAAINQRGFELDMGTGVRVMKRYLDGHLFGGWTASMAMTVPWPVAPYVELGFDAGEVLGEVIIDRAVKNSKGRNWIDPDAFIGAGVRFSLSRRVQLKTYYKRHYVESGHSQTTDSDVYGVALVFRFPRQHLEWWQIPL